MRLLQQANIESSPIITEQGYQSTSDRYKLINSRDIIDTFERQGLEFQGVSVAKTKIESKRGYQKHLMLFETPYQIDDDNRLTLMVTNSHDGTMALKIDIGVFRLVCANGLIAGNDIFTRSVQHKGQFFQERLSESISESLRMLPEIERQVREWQKIAATNEMLQRFEQYVIDTRLPDNVSRIDRNSINRVLRSGDKSNDLYTVFNRYQEKLIRGGIKYEGLKIVDGKCESKKQTTRAITSISKKVELNKGIWNFAEKLAA